MNQRTVATALRWLAAAAVFLFFMFWSFFLATLIGWDFRPQGPHRVLEKWPVLVVAVGAGLLAIAGARLILRHQVLSWWLLVALLIPTLVAVDQAGLL